MKTVYVSDESDAESGGEDAMETQTQLSQAAQGLSFLEALDLVKHGLTSATAQRITSSRYKKIVCVFVL